MSVNCSFPPSDLTKFKVTDHEKAAKKLREWASKPSSRPTGPLDSAEALAELSLIMPKDSLLQLNFWGGGANPKEPKLYQVMVPTDALFKAGEKYVECLDDKKEKYEVDPIYTQLLVGNSPPAPGEMWNYRIAEYTFSHCY